MAGRHSVEIRLARPDEYAAVGDLTARVYLGDDLVSIDSPYLRELRDATARARETDVIVAAEPDGGVVLGAVAFVLPGSTYAELAGGREAEFRMLVVDPEARGRGVGARLVGTCVDRARAVGATTLRLSTQVTMRSAHRLYERLGFRRTPDRDHTPVMGVTLLAYALDLGPVYCAQCGEPRGGDPHEQCASATRPPRWCASCRRPLEVEVTPTGWSARCARHGEAAG